MLEYLPLSLKGQAKRAFDNLKEQDRISKEALLQALRIKLDPQSEARNRKMFMDAQKIPNESMTAFIDRCRTFIKRSGADPQEKLLNELLKRKVL